jgi:hypothetical protein
MADEKLIRALGAFPDSPTRTLNLGPQPAAAITMIRLGFGIEVWKPKAEEVVCSLGPPQRLRRVPDWQSYGIFIE